MSAMSASFRASPSFLSCNKTKVRHRILMVWTRILITRHIDGDGISGAPLHEKAAAVNEGNIARGRPKVNTHVTPFLHGVSITPTSANLRNLEHLQRKLRGCAVTDMSICS